MTQSVDLNSDLGEGYGPWTMGDDAALMQVITSANVACGGHAGDPDVMARAMGLAIENGVGIGAHPGFADRQGFGRRRLPLKRAEIVNLIRYQVGAAQGMARALGGNLHHIKLHGALSNMAAEDANLAHDCYGAALAVAPEAILMAQAGTGMEEAAKSLGAAWAGEVFADRAYNTDATLVDRAIPGAVLRDPGEVAARVVEMVKTGGVPTIDGGRLDVAVDTICVHGDTSEAVSLAKAVRAGLQAAGITLARFTGR